jgi:hypothetical protein
MRRRVISALHPRSHAASWARRILVIATAFTACLLIAPSGSSHAAPVSCRMGAYVQSLSDIDPAAGTFDADVWLWSLCPDQTIDPLKSLEVVNSVDVESSMDSTQEKDNQWWSNRKIAGKFRQDFAVSNFPFDKQTLVIRLEEGGQNDSRSLKYIADGAGSKLDPNISLRNWAVTSFRIIASENTYPTSYGDPSLPDGESTYPRLDLEIGLQQGDEVGDFVKATFAVYIAVLLALFSLMIEDGRAELLGATVFTVVISYISTDGLVGQHTNLYLLDKVHLLALAVIVAAGIWLVRSAWVASAGGGRTVSHRQDLVAAGVLFALYVVMNVVLIGSAVSSSP